MKHFVLGLLILQSMGCATGDFALIDERYNARVERCEDPSSDDRRVWKTRDACVADAQRVRDEGRSNQYSLRRLWPGSGGGAGNTRFTYILN